MAAEVTLRGTLHTRDLVIYGLVFMIPLAPAAMYGTYLVPAHGMVALCYLIGMAAMLFTGLSYRSMARKYPFAGSVYLYVQKSLSPHLGFLTGWSVLLDYFLMPVTVVIIGSSFANSLLPQIPMWAWSVLFILFSTVTNIWSIEWLAKCSWILFIFQMLVLLAFSICTLHMLWTQEIQWNTLSFYNPEEFELSGVLQATGIVILSYLGFDAISTLAEESIEPKKSVGRAILWAILLSGVLFVFTTFLAGLACPDYQALNPDTAFIDIVQFVGGDTLTIFTTAVLVTSFGLATCQTSEAAVARVLFAMGRDGILPKFLARINVVHQTPYAAILLVSVVITPLSLLCSLEDIAVVVSFGALVGFAFLNIAVIWRFFIKDKENRQNHLLRSAVQYALFPGVGLMVTLSIFINLDQTAHLIGFGWMLAGAVYLFAVTHGFHEPVPQMELN